VRIWNIRSASVHASLPEIRVCSMGVCSKTALFRIRSQSASAKSVISTGRSVSTRPSPLHGAWCMLLLHITHHSFVNTNIWPCMLAIHFVKTMFKLITIFKVSQQMRICEIFIAKQDQRQCEARGPHSPPPFGLKFVQTLVHCCSWLFTETQCKIISVQQN